MENRALFKPKKSRCKPRHLKPQLDNCCITGTFNGYCVEVKDKYGMEVLHEEVHNYLPKHMVQSYLYKLLDCDGNNKAQHLD